MNIIPGTRMFASVFAVSDICRCRAFLHVNFSAFPGAFPHACFELSQTFLTNKLICRIGFKTINQAEIVKQNKNIAPNV